MRSATINQIQDRLFVFEVGAKTAVVQTVMRAFHTAMKIEGNPVVAVNYDRLELLKFLKRDFLPMNVMCERAGMFEDRIFERTKAVFKYFDLPFDASSPR